MKFSFQRIDFGLKRSYKAPMDIPSNARIAWVEDDVDIIGSMLNRFQYAGVQVDKYRDFGSAWVRRNQISKSHILVLDLILPYDGQDLVKVAGESIRDANHIYAGLELLRGFRREAISIPTLVFSVVHPDHIPGGSEVLHELHAKYIEKPSGRVDLESAIMETTGWVGRRGYIESHLGRI